MTDPAAILEADWQQQLIELAHLLGWRHLHVRKSIGKGSKWQTTTNMKGWPDLLLWSTRQPGRHIAVELKSESGTPTPEQVEVLAELEAAGFECFVWRPSDLDTAQSVLAGTARIAP